MNLREEDLIIGGAAAVAPPTGEEAELVRYTTQYNDSQKQVEDALTNIKRILSTRGFKRGDVIKYSGNKYLVWSVSSSGSDSYLNLARDPASDKNEPITHQEYVRDARNKIQGFLGTINLDILN